MRSPCVVAIVGFLMIVFEVKWGEVLSHPCCRDHGISDDEHPVTWSDQGVEEHEDEGANAVAPHRLRRSTCAGVKALMA